eukprot:gene11439-15326_t
MKANNQYFKYLRIFDNFGPTLFRVAFSWCVGILATSIAVFRNSMVFHSDDHITILAVHISPNLAIYGMKWFHNDLEQSFPSTFNIGCDDQYCEGTLFDLVAMPILFYIILWTIPYSWYFFVYGKKRIEEEGLHTMYTTMSRNQAVQNFISIFGEKWKPVMYMIMHFICCSSSYILGVLSWHSFYFHTIYLLMLLCLAIWNGGSYYFQVFADKYAKLHPKTN